MQYNKYLLAFALLASSALASVNFDELADKVVKEAGNSVAVTKMKSDNLINAYQETAFNAIEYEKLKLKGDVIAALNTAFDAFVADVFENGDDKTLTSRKKEIETKGVITDQMSLIESVEAATKTKIEESVLKEILTKSKEDAEIIVANIEAKAAKDAKDAKNLDDIVDIAGENNAFKDWSEYNGKTTLEEEQHKAIKGYELKALKPLTKDELRTYLAGRDLPAIVKLEATAENIMKFVDDEKLRLGIDLSEVIELTPEQLTNLNASGFQFTEPNITAALKTDTALIDPTLQTLKGLYENGKLKDETELEKYKLRKVQKDALKVEGIDEGDKIKEILTPVKPTVQALSALVDTTSKKLKNAAELARFILTEAQKTALGGEGLDDKAIEEILMTDEQKAAAKMNALAEKIWTVLQTKKIGEFITSDFGDADPKQIKALKDAAELKDEAAVLEILQKNVETGPEKKTREENELKKAAEEKLQTLADQIKNAISDKQSFNDLDKTVIDAFKLSEAQATALKNVNPKKGDDILKILQGTVVATGGDKPQNEAGGSTGTVKDKPDSDPIYKKTWFIATVSALALAGIGGSAYLMMSRQTEETDL